MKLYRVTLTRELLVLAEAEEDAEDLALQNERDENPGVHARLVDRLYGDEPESLVWHAGREDITGAEALARSNTSANRLRRGRTSKAR